MSGVPRVFVVNQSGGGASPPPNYYNDILSFLTSFDSKLSQLVVDQQLIINSVDDIVNKLNSSLSVQVSNFPSSQTINGTVQIESGSVTIANVPSVRVLEMPTTPLNVTGNVGIVGTPSVNVQSTSGTVNVNGGVSVVGTVTVGGSVSLVGTSPVSISGPITATLGPASIVGVRPVVSVGGVLTQGTFDADINSPTNPVVTLKTNVALKTVQMISHSDQVGSSTVAPPGLPATDYILSGARVGNAATTIDNMPLVCVGGLRAQQGVAFPTGTGWKQARILSDSTGVIANQNQSVTPHVNSGILLDIKASRYENEDDFVKV